MLEPIRTLALSLSFLCAGVAPAAAAPPDPSLIETDAPPIEVMVLGTYHFTGGGADLHNADVDDHLSAQRQTEIDAVVEALSEFAPDKVMVELEPRLSAEFNAAYEAWLAGERALSVNERQQLGMRLAGRMGHERLYAVDYKNGMDFEAMVAAAEAAGERRILEEFANFNARVPEVMTQFETGPVSARLRAANSQVMHDLHANYLTLAQAGSVEDPVGAEQMGAWWRRNLTIFARAAHHAEPGERIVVIYGAGHKHLLEQFFSDAAGFRLVDPLDYLPE